jgi:hypothetical protein
METNNVHAIRPPGYLANEIARVGFKPNGSQVPAAFVGEDYVYVRNTPLNRVVGVWLATDVDKSGTNYIDADDGLTTKNIGQKRGVEANYKHGFFQLDTTLADGTDVIVEYYYDQKIQPVHMDTFNKMKVSTGEGWQETSYLAEGGYSPDAFSVNKFGANPLITTSVEDVWEYGGTHTFMAAAAGLKISSSLGGDSDVDVTVEGLDANWNLKSVVVNTDGQTEKDIDGGSTWIRVNRAYVSGATAATGTIYIYEDDTVVAGVPQTASKIHATILPAEQQTKISFYSVPANHTGFIYSYEASTQAVAGVLTVTLQIREFGGVFKTKHVFQISGAGDSKTWKFPLVASAKSDIKVVGITSVGNHDVETSYELLIRRNGS